MPAVVLLLSLLATPLTQVETLVNASPATVSRAGIIFVSDTDLDWSPVVEGWILKRPAAEQPVFKELFARCVSVCLCVRVSVSMSVSVCRHGETTSFLRPRRLEQTCQISRAGCAFYRRCDICSSQGFSFCSLLQTGLDDLFVSHRWGD